MYSGTASGDVSGGGAVSTGVAGGGAASGGVTRVQPCHVFFQWLGVIHGNVFFLFLGTDG
jgi:hypothetical protein